MIEECYNRNITLLNDLSVIIDEVKFYGSPVQPWFHSWAFNRERGAEIKQHWDMIDSDTNVLITHGMPFGILDTVCYADGTPKEQVGCHDLLARIKELPNLDLYMGGHLHSDGGKEIHLNGVSYYNCAVCDEMYLPINGIRVIDYEKG